ncbi:TPA: NADH-quinone oxidoreductase subunit L [Proteus mirabilis]|uniref:NADH-quinone oxidoreductase subunit L n=1 Tax=Proteus sp. G2674 TaxID=2698886 RepID=UPI001378D966|nr:NADH-quinone oxidoreductase subunit L [Proteus sp. G2674]NBL84729.1 NADH-quinone oxidoreductase subunit L [Proteus sp. G2674]
MNILYLTFVLPLLGFLLLAFSGGRWSENVSAWIGTGAVGLSALVALWVGIDFFAHGQETEVLTLWTWMSAGNFTIPFTLVLDGLSLTMLGVITGVGFLIHMYASWYMRGEEGYSRFFAYTNLFIASMVVLVLADNMMLMYMGWEGVGLCSYLLIGFYYNNPANGAAAMKAFIVTRIGDVFLAIGMFILFDQLGTLSFREMAVLAPEQLTAGSSIINWAMLMVLGGAVGKSAQLPLQTWLADAMAGPTPVSALIHAATMVTAGVYLVARSNALFLMAPDILELVGIVGAVTLVLAGFAALVQTDIKRILAYSTMSQIGYMFLALGAQAWDGAIFHLMTHAFFKALLFLSAGSVIIACHHEQNIFKMGGLRKKIPFVYACFLIGGGALAALPLLTAGFFSKDEILWGAYANGHFNLMLAGLIGAFFTSLYTFRLIFIVFHGETKTEAHQVKGFTHTFPLAVLALLSTFIGALITQPLGDVFPESTVTHEGKYVLEILSGVVAIVGVAIAAWLYLKQRQLVSQVANTKTGRFFSTWWFHAWGFDALYEVLFVKPYKGAAWLIQNDPVNQFFNLFGCLFKGANKGLSFSENGLARWYAASLGLGAVLVIALLLLV